MEQIGALQVAEGVMLVDWPPHTNPLHSLQAESQHLAAIAQIVSLVLAFNMRGRGTGQLFWKYKAQDQLHSQGGDFSYCPSPHVKEEKGREDKTSWVSVPREFIIKLRESIPGRVILVFLSGEQNTLQQFACFLMVPSFDALASNEFEPEFQLMDRMQFQLLNYWGNSWVEQFLHTESLLVVERAIMSKMLMVTGQLLIPQRWILLSHCYGQCPISMPFKVF